MSCGCAKRARRLLAKVGYELRNGDWVHGTHVIPDADIEKHHARITAEAGAHLARETARNAADRLTAILGKEAPK